MTRMSTRLMIMRTIIEDWKCNSDYDANRGNDREDDSGKIESTNDDSDDREDDSERSKVGSQMSRLRSINGEECYYSRTHASPEYGICKGKVCDVGPAKNVTTVGDIWTGRTKYLKLRLFKWTHRSHWPIMWSLRCGNGEECYFSRTHISREYWIFEEGLFKCEVCDVGEAKNATLEDIPKIWGDPGWRATEQPWMWVQGWNKDGRYPEKGSRSSI